MTAVDPQAPVLATGLGDHRRPGRAPAGRRCVARLADVVSAYVALTKPRIVELLLLTTVPVMFLAERGVPSLWLVRRDRRRRHAGRRQRQRPQLCLRPRHRRADAAHAAAPAAAAPGLEPRRPWSSAWCSASRRPCCSGFAVNWLSAGLALAANVFYVLGYTMVLKRRTAQNIVWGGAAGCFPALIGWTAVTGSLAWPPVVLFLVVFFWTPPHFWSLAIRYRDDYAAADGADAARGRDRRAMVGRQIVIYSWLTVATSLLLWPVASTGWLYPSSPLVLGCRVSSSRRTRCGGGPGTTEDPVALKAMRLFHGSNAYLALLFLAVAIDPLLTS